MSNRFSRAMALRDAIRHQIREAAPTAAQVGKEDTTSNEKDDPFAAGEGAETLGAASRTCPGCGATIRRTERVIPAVCPLCGRP